MLSISRRVSKTGPASSSDRNCNIYHTCVCSSFVVGSNIDLTGCHNYSCGEIAIIPPLQYRTWITNGQTKVLELLRDSQLYPCSCLQSINLVQSDSPLFMQFHYEIRREHYVMAAQTQIPWIDERRFTRGSLLYTRKGHLSLHDNPLASNNVGIK
jgi:hypothetical protein